MTNHHMRRVVSYLPFAALVSVAGAASAQTPGGNDNQPDTPGTGHVESAKRFVGENCGLCRDTQWSLQRKQFPAVAGGH
jgi:hypothetical protein